MGQESHLPETLHQHVEFVIQALKDGRVGHKGRLGAGLAGWSLADGLDRRHRPAALVPLAIDLAVAADLDLEPFRQGVDGRNADAVQSGSDLVAAAAELAAGMEDGHHHLQGVHRLAAGPFLRWVWPDRDTPTVILDRHRVVGVDDDLDPVAGAGQRLVDRVVDDLLHEVVQAPEVGRADVHARPAAHGLQSLQDLNVGSFVAGRCLIGDHTAVLVFLRDGSSRAACFWRLALGLLGKGLDLGTHGVQICANPFLFSDKYCLSLIRWHQLER